uniref:Uncharacterized protein n=1 Tax=viral metagenome TaxID=1070528 RepID=A0A6H1ZFD5_9ZZZZ
METASEYQVEVRPDARELMVVPNVTFRTNALIFNRPIDLEVVKQLTEGLDKFKTAHPWFFSDMWREMALRGYEWVEHVPDSINLGTAQTWYKVGSKFLPDDRVYDRLQFSHYAATRALPDVEAHKVLEAANEGGWTEKAVREAVKLLLGNPPKVPKPKVIQCAHCDNWIAETDKGCGWCFYTIAQQRIESFQAVLTELANPSGDLEWAVELANRVLAEV